MAGRACPHERRGNEAVSDRAPTCQKCQTGCEVIERRGLTPHMLPRTKRRSHLLHLNIERYALGTDQAGVFRLVGKIRLSR